MAEPQVSSDQIRTAINQARQTALQIDSLRAANGRTISTLEAALNGASSLVSEPTEAQGRRSGIRSRIEADDHLRTFILARIRALTFEQVLAEVAANFSPDRRPSRSALHRWWHRHGKRSGQAQPPETT